MKKLKIPQATKQGYIEIEPGGVFDAAYPDSPTRRGRVQEGGGNLEPLVYLTNKRDMENNQLNLPPELQGKKFRIRKLTPRECFRLMDVDDADIDKIQASGISNSAQYKLAGNSIVVNVLYHLFRKLFVETGPDVVKGEAEQLKLF